MGLDFLPINLPIHRFTADREYKARLRGSLRRARPFAALLRWKRSWRSNDMRGKRNTFLAATLPTLVFLSAATLTAAARQAPQAGASAPGGAPQAGGAPG